MGVSKCNGNQLGPVAFPYNSLLFMMIFVVVRNYGKLSVKILLRFINGYLVGGIFFFFISCTNNYQILCLTYPICCLK